MGAALIYGIAAMPLWMILGGLVVRWIEGPPDDRGQS